MELSELLNKKHVYFVERGNIALQILLKLARNYSNHLLIQKDGGWLTYEPFGRKLGFDITKVDLSKRIPFKNAVLILHSMAGYHSLLDMKNIQKQCKKNNILLINDASGSIGLKEAKIGDYILVSSNKDKPLNYERVGIIATNNELNIEEVIINKEEFTKKLNNLQERLAFLQEKKEKAKNLFKDFDIVEKKGINIIVLFNTKEEKNNIIKICENNKYEYTECPRYIRLLKKGISVEVKRC